MGDFDNLLGQLVGHVHSELGHDPKQFNWSIVPPHVREVMSQEAAKFFCAIADEQHRQAVTGDEEESEEYRQSQVSRMAALVRKTSRARGQSSSLTHLSETIRRIETSDTREDAEVITTLLRGVAERAWNKCAFCNVDSSVAMRCGGCKQVRYCNRTCQRNHWATHRVVCMSGAKCHPAAPTKKK